jgi:hypothetical protein
VTFWVEHITLQVLFEGMQQVGGGEAEVGRGGSVLNAPNVRLKAPGGRAGRKKLAGPNRLSSLGRAAS